MPERILWLMANPQATLTDYLLKWTRKRGQYYYDRRIARRLLTKYKVIELKHKVIKK